MSVHVAAARAAAAANPLQRPVTLQPIPSSAHYMNVRELLTATQWKRLRDPLAEDAGNCCELCGGRGERWPTECHEWWDYDDQTHTARLRRLIILCPNCHHMQHFGFFGGIGVLSEQDVINYLVAINQWSTVQSRAHIKEAQTTWAERSQYQWQINTDAIALDIDDAPWLR
jgi:hypothetical protein